MTHGTLERYHRHTILKGFGAEGQEKLHTARVLVVGAGGLGVPVLTYLNAMGVGTLGVVDHDVVQLSNLHRQVLYDEAQVGMPKVTAALEKLKAQNSNTRLVAHHCFLNTENVMDILSDYDLVVDASDNFPTRYLINDACVLQRKPFVYGALHGFEGQVSVFNHKNGPTYRCLFPQMPKAEEVPNCNEHGVLGILPGIIGNLQALEAIKIITGVGEVLSGTLLIYDALDQRIQRIQVPLDHKNLKITALAKAYALSCGQDEEQISVQGLMKLLDDEGAYLVDVRSTTEYATGHIPGSNNIPLPELMERLAEVRLDAPVYVICQSGVRSAAAVDQLKEQLPLGRYINVIGGMNQYSDHANSR